MEQFITQTLLSAWIYYINSDEQYTEQTYESFLSTLKRERKEKTIAMRNGILFESIINQIVDGEFTDVPENWKSAVDEISTICKGGIKQVPVSQKKKICGIDFVMYGVCDYVKAGNIYDIKKVNRYEYGKYFTSPQHPMYLSLVPEASRFEYLIFDGKFVYREPYNRYDCEPIEKIIQRFVVFLRENNLFEIYQKYWMMNTKRGKMIQDV